jgi:NAD(P)-dependent dehydrogenase (short-subunit alcohol dehydrogenase family)
VRKEDDVRALVDKTVARFGRLDNAVNNAATEGDRGLITAQTAKSFAATFDTNVLRVVLSMKHEVRAMQAQGSGSIINISSTYGMKARPELRSTLGPNTLSKASPSRWCSRSPSREFA